MLAYIRPAFGGEGTMNRIPVGQTISRSYAFAFGDYPALLGVVWLPLTVIGIADYFVMMPLFQNMDTLFTPAGMMSHAYLFRWIFVIDLLGS
jgi:hypothetical protein